MLSKQVVEAISRMPDKVRQVFKLSHDRGLSIQEIAETLRIRERQAESLLSCGNALIYLSGPRIAWKPRQHQNYISRLFSKLWRW